MTQLTREGLANALWAKGALTHQITGNCLLYSLEHAKKQGAAWFADLIRLHSLAQVLVPGTRPPLTFDNAYREVFGERLKL